MTTMKRAARLVGMFGLGLAIVVLVILHALPAPLLYATTGARIPYCPWNFLSEYARTDYALLMTACFFLLALGTLATAIVLPRRLRREAILLAIAAIAMALLGFFPTDLADLSTDAVTCGKPTRIEPCTLVGRIHNPLSTLVLLLILLTILSFCVRSRREACWQGVVRLATICGALALVGIVAATIYRYEVGWQGRWWTGLMQRSLVFPALLWIIGLFACRAEDKPVMNDY